MESLKKPKQQYSETQRLPKEETQLPPLESKRKPRGRRQKKDKKDLPEEKPNLRYVIEEESKKALQTPRKKTSTSDLIYENYFMSARQGGRPRIMEKSSKRPQKASRAKF